jgi:phytanoyl-CoA hydroxylase
MSIATAPSSTRSSAPSEPSRTVPHDAAQAVTDDQVKAFVERGFHVGENLIPAAELAELKADMLTIARGGYPSPTLRPLPAAMSDEAVLQNILCIHQPHHISPVMRRFAEHPAICGILSRITAAHLAHWDGAVKCMQTMLFVKPPGKQGQAWHQDERYIPTRDRSLIGAWIAIDDATIGNGCLWVVPGSHRHGYLFPTRDHGQPDEYDASDMAHGFDERQAVAVEVKAGSVVFFNGYLLHKSLRNRSPVYRRALVSHYMNAWSLLPWFEVDTPTGRTSVGLADVRKVFPVAGVDPYAWKGTEDTGDEVYLRHYARSDNPAAGG